MPLSAEYFSFLKDSLTKGFGMKTEKCGEMANNVSRIQTRILDFGRADPVLFNFLVERAPRDPKPPSG